MVCWALQCRLSVTSSNPGVQANYVCYIIANMDYHYSFIFVDLINKYVDTYIYSHFKWHLFYVYLAYSEY